MSAVKPSASGQVQDKKSSKLDTLKKATVKNTVSKRIGHGGEVILPKQPAKKPLAPIENKVITKRIAPKAQAPEPIAQKPAKKEIPKLSTITPQKPVISKKIVTASANDTKKSATQLAQPRKLAAPPAPAVAGSTIKTQATKLAPKAIKSVVRPADNKTAPITQKRIIPTTKTTAASKIPVKTKLIPPAPTKKQAPEKKKESRPITNATPLKVAKTGQSDPSRTARNILPVVVLDSAIPTVDLKKGNNPTLSAPVIEIHLIEETVGQIPVIVESKTEEQENKINQLERGNTDCNEVVSEEITCQPEEHPLNTLEETSTLADSQSIESVPPCLEEEGENETESYLSAHTIEVIMEEELIEDSEEEIEVIEVKEEEAEGVEDAPSSTQEGEGTEVDVPGPMQAEDEIKAIEGEWRTEGKEGEGEEEIKNKEMEQLSKEINFRLNLEPTEREQAEEEAEEKEEKRVKKRRRRNTIVGSRKMKKEKKIEKIESPTESEEEKEEEKEEEISTPLRRLRKGGNTPSKREPSEENFQIKSKLELLIKSKEKASESHTFSESSSRTRRAKQQASQTIIRDTERKLERKREAGEIIEKLGGENTLYWKNNFSLIDNEAVCSSKARQGSDIDEGSDESSEFNDFIVPDEDVGEDIVQFGSACSRLSVSEEVLNDSFNYSESDTESEAEREETSSSDEIEEVAHSQPNKLDDSFEILSENSLEILENSLEIIPSPPKKHKHSHAVIDLGETSLIDLVDSDSIVAEDDESIAISFSNAHANSSSKWNLTVANSDELISLWNKIKMKEKEKIREYKSLLIDPEFAKRRKAIANKSYEQFNEKVFGSKLPANLAITWELKKGCAGYCLLTGNKNYPTVELINLCPNYNKTDNDMKTTLLHEMCHAAAWLFDKKVTHCKVWLKYIKVAEKHYPEYSPIGRSLLSGWEYPYFCSNVTCSAEYFAHTRSTRKFCRKCSFSIVLPPFWREPARFARPLNKFACFVQNNYPNVKLDNPSLSHKELMEIISKKYHKGNN